MKTVIQNGSNNLGALALSVYTEALGGFYMGSFEYSRRNYNAFIYTFFPPEYNEVDSHLAKNGKRDGLYKSVRCSLVHEYLNQDKLMSIMDYGGNKNCGISYDPDRNPEIKFYVKQYFQDFRKAFDYYLGVMGLESYLSLTFIRALRSINSKLPISYQFF
jgi:hypothetical protein